MLNLVAPELRRTFTVAALVLILIASTHLHAQSVTGTILGNCLDSTGAAVPNVEITITNQDTGVVRKVASTGEGTYSAPSLLPGVYSVEARVPGFAPVQVKDIVVRVGSDARADLKLQVGQVNQQVTVTEAVPLVETTSSEVSQVMSEETIAQIPLNARDVQQLAVIQPGVQFMNTGFGGRAMTVAGDRPTNNRFLQEGMDLTWTYRLSPVSLPSNVMLGVEAVKEFKVLTTNFTVEYGEQSGGVVNTLFKSGTNTLHGSAYEFYRNAVLDARNFFDQGAAPPFTRHQFGGALGGPIRKDKTFFFVNYEGFRSSLSQSFVANFPNKAARGAGGGTPGLLPCDVVGAGCGANPSGTLVSVPVSTDIYRIFFAGSNPLFPACNGPDVGGGLCQWFSNPIQTISENYALVKIDHSFGSKNTLSAHYNFDQSWEYSPVQTGATADDQAFRRQTATVQDTHLVSSNVVNTARFGVNRIYYNNEQDIVGGIERVDPALVGIPLSVKCATQCTAPSGVFASGVTTPLPAITIPGMRTFASAVQPAFNYAPRWVGYTSGILSDDVNYLRGKHAFQFGFQGKKWDDNVWNYASNSRGPYTFASLTQFLTGGPAQSWSAYVPGQVQNARAFRLYMVSLYGQDTYKLKSNLALTYGIRWEYVPGPSEAHGYLANINNPGPESSVTPAVGTLFTSSKRNFAPRVGFNWDPFKSGKTSIRGGFGVFFNEIEDNSYFGSGLTGQYPFTTTASISSSTVTGCTVAVTPCPAANRILGMTLPFQQSRLDAAVAAGLKPSFSGEFEANPKTPTKYGYNLTLQQELPGRLSVLVAYVGSQSRHNGRSTSFQEYYPTAIAAPGQLPMLNGQPIAGSTINPNCTEAGQITCYYWAGVGIQNANVLGSNPAANPTTFQYATNCTATVTSNCFVNNNFGNSIGGTIFDANSSYNSFQTTLERRTSSGLFTRFNYTYAVCMEDAADDLPSSETNGGGAAWSPVRNRTANRHRCAFGGTNSANLSLNYDLPFGRTAHSRLAKIVESGWQLTSLTALSSGIPFDVRLGVNGARAANSGTGAARPDLVAGCDANNMINKHNPTNYFKLSCLAAPPLGYLGDMPPLFLTSPSTWTTDMGLKKNIAVRESMNVQLSADMFNAFNRTNFASPDSATAFINSGSNAVPNITPVSSSGQINSTVGTSRQFQIGAKFSF